MAKAGYCSECKQNVWLKNDGSCQNGHSASQISNTYEVKGEAESHQQDASLASKANKDNQELSQPDVDSMKAKEDVDGLIKTLKHRNPDLRRRAAWALGGIKDKRAVEPLLQALKDQDKWVQEQAAWALGIIKDERAVEPLLQVIKDVDYNARGKVASALGEIGDKRATESLIETLRDSDVYVLWDAAFALSKMRDKKAIESLIQILKNDEGEIRAAAAMVLGDWGEERATEPLIDALKDKNSTARRRAAEALGEIGSSKAVGPLRQLLGDSDVLVRQAATFSIMSIEKKAGKTSGAVSNQSEVKASSSAENKVEKKSRDTSDLSEAGVEQLVARRDVEGLITILKHQNSDVRKSVACALGEIGDRKAVSSLRQALKDDDVDVQQAAALAILAISGAGEEVREIMKEVPGQTKMGMDTHMKEDAADKGMSKPNVQELKEKKDINGLIAALRCKKESVNDNDVLVREYAIQALGEIGDKKAVEPLIDALRDKVWDVQYDAVTALGKIGNQRAVEPIKRCVIETDVERVRGRGMIVLDEVFNLDKEELRKTFLNSRAPEEAKTDLLEKEEQAKRECGLAIEGPKFGPVGQEALDAILKDVHSRVVERYGALIKEIRPMASLDVGGTSFYIKTYPVTNEQAVEINNFCMECLKEHKPR